MLIEGKFVIKAPIQKVWDHILEPETLGSCMPGAEKVAKIDDKTYDAVVKQKVAQRNAGPANYAVAKGDVDLQQEFAIYFGHWPFCSGRGAGLDRWRSLQEGGNGCRPRRAG